MLDFLFTGPENGSRLALAHGAGAPMDSEFMTFMADALADHGVRVARFEFPYMAARRTGGKKRPPDSQGVLLDTWREVVRALGNPATLIIGGKSMGGRMASLVADELSLRGLVCLGYPFHPPGKPEKTRTAHLQNLQTPTLIVQGSRDALGSADDVAQYTLSPHIHVHWIDGGNHDLAALKKSGRTAQDCWRDAAARIAEFMQDQRTA